MELQGRLAQVFPSLCGRPRQSRHGWRASIKFLEPLDWKALECVTFLEVLDLKCWRRGVLEGPRGLEALQPGRGLEALTPLEASGGCWRSWRQADPAPLWLSGPEIRSQEGPWTPKPPLGFTLEKTSQRPHTLKAGFRVLTLYWSRGELFQVPGLSWVLQYPWLWEGRRATWIDLRHRSRGISAAHHRRWAAYAMSLGLRV